MRANAWQLKTRPTGHWLVRSESWREARGRFDQSFHTSSTSLHQGGLLKHESLRSSRDAREYLTRYEVRVREIDGMSVRIPFRAINQLVKAEGEDETHQNGLSQITAMPFGTLTPPYSTSLDACFGIANGATMKKRIVSLHRLTRSGTFSSRKALFPAVMRSPEHAVRILL
ncbi:hypothetical protein AC579_1771 [Pseudocercospora musae]|uniref:Uncharacterized protein n=1 Tax=Pseudocercospora musae TaxID=113226 RepID=A0A139IPI2_9PEZI|nr:hypothetical protein AC579_1771 [Pseudocercospora musae]KXT16457.1 hypothetical protein AC579_1771 [Pseudocercospora musae]